MPHRLDEKLHPKESFRQRPSLGEGSKAGRPSWLWTSSACRALLRRPGLGSFSAGAAQKFLIIFKTLYFHFALGPANFVVVLITKLSVSP